MKRYDDVKFMRYRLKRAAEVAVLREAIELVATDSGSSALGEAVRTLLGLEPKLQYEP